MKSLIAVGLGGFVGATLRYGIGLLMLQRWPRMAFPLGTLTVNVLGCFFIGILLMLVETRHLNSQSWRLFLITGLLGSLTTFSTFSHESLKLVRDEAYRSFLLYFAGNLILGAGAVILGRWIAGKLWT